MLLMLLLLLLLGMVVVVFVAIVDGDHVDRFDPDLPFFFPVMTMMMTIRLNRIQLRNWIWCSTDHPPRPIIAIAVAVSFSVSTRM